MKELIRLLEDILDYEIIGPHCRHIIEHYKKVTCGYKHDVSEITYESKERDMMLQKDKHYALHTLRQIEHELFQIDLEDMVLVDGYTSSFGREVAYAHDHMVHHCAIIRLILRENDLEYLISDTFGVSQSTQKYKNKH